MNHCGRQISVRLAQAARLFLPLLLAGIGLALLLSVVSACPGQAESAPAVGHPALNSAAAAWAASPPLGVNPSPQELAATRQVLAAGSSSLFDLFWASFDAPSAETLAWGDYNGDGDLDLALNNSFLVLVYENDGRGHLSRAWTSPSYYPNYVLSVAWGDVNNDGLLDLAVGYGGGLNTSGEYYYEGGPNRLLRNTSTATTTAFNPDYWVSVEQDPTYSVAWGDYDNDGRLDLVVANGSTGSGPDEARQYSRLYHNNGGGSFSLAPGFTAFYQATSVAWADYDNDGRLDLALGMFGSPGLALYHNNGGGAFALAWTSAQTGTATSLAWGDYDNDGRLDLAVGHGECYSDHLLAQPVQVYHNNGGGAFALAWTSAQTGTATSLAWGDYNRDGWLDLAVGNYCGSVANCRSVRVYRNTSGNLGTTATWSSTVVTNTTSVAWGDYNKDGYPDLAAGTYCNDVPGCPSLRLYRNSAGTLSLLWSWNDGYNTQSLAW